MSVSDRIDTEQAAEVLQGLINTTDSLWSEKIRRSAISRERLGEIARWASQSNVFEEDSPACPLLLFGRSAPRVRESTTEGKERSVVFTQYPKSALLAEPVEPRAVNEEGWFKDVMQGYVLESLFKEIMSGLAASEAAADSPDAYWAQLQTYAADCAETGLRPILFIGNPAFPEWILKWQYSAAYPDMPKPPGFVFWRDAEFIVEGNKNGYLGTFGKVPAFHAPQLGRESFLIARESLGAIAFFKRPMEDLVKVTWEEPESGDGLSGRLVLAWRAEVEVERHPAFRLIYA